MNGVKQGGVLSPILFCIYMDELLCRLTKSGVGCYIGNRFIGAMCYADDLTIISPSRRSMDILLQICENYAKEFHVTFNSSKSFLITYNVNLDVSFMLDNEVINRVESAIHLGHYVGIDNNKNNIVQGNRHLICRTNTMLSRFGFCSSSIKSKLFRTYCTSFYGCPLWDLSSKCINNFYIAWRKCIRRVFGLPPRTHNRLVNTIFDDVPIDIQLLTRLSGFFVCVINSDNPIVTICGELCKYSNTAVGKNRRHLLHLLNNNDTGLCNTKIKTAHLLRQVTSYDQIDICTSMFILELRNILDGNYTLSNLNYDELNTILHNLCTQ